MGITLKPGQLPKIRKNVQALLANVDKAALYYYSYMGEYLVGYARNKHTYTDRTGNLTNSMGYAVVQEGKVVKTSLDDMQGESLAKARETINKMVDKVSAKYSLIIVAGMEYAAYVEAKGYNVLLPAELEARLQIPGGIAKIQQMAKSKTLKVFGI